MEKRAVKKSGVKTKKRETRSKSQECRREKREGRRENRERRAMRECSAAHPCSRMNLEHRVLLQAPCQHLVRQEGKCLLAESGAGHRPLTAVAAHELLSGVSV